MEVSDDHVYTEVTGEVLQETIKSLLYLLIRKGLVTPEEAGSLRGQPLKDINDHPLIKHLTKLTKQIEEVGANEVQRLTGSGPYHLKYMRAKAIADEQMRRALSDEYGGFVQDRPRSRRAKLMTWLTTDLLRLEWRRRAHNTSMKL